jgi:hypothetical protein
MRLSRVNPRMVIGENNLDSVMTGRPSKDRGDRSLARNYWLGMRFLFD